MQLKTAIHWQETHEIRTYEVDFAQRLKLNSIFNFMQEAASNSANSLGFGHEDLVKEGFFWVLSRVKLEIVDGLTLGQQLTVETWPKGIDGFFATRDFRMYDEQQNVICRATTSWAALNAKTMRPHNPAELPQRLLVTDTDSAIDEVPGKIAEPEEKELVYQKEIRYLDIDFLQHVNNVKYVEYVLDCFTLNDYRRAQIKSLQVNFLAEAKFGDTLSFSKKAVSDKVFYVDGENQTGKKIFQALVEWE